MSRAAFQSAVEVLVGQLWDVLRLEQVLEGGDRKPHVLVGEDGARRVDEPGILPGADGERLGGELALHGVADRERADGRDDARLLFDEAIELLDAPRLDARDVVVVQRVERDVGVGDVGGDAVADAREHAAAAKAIRREVEPVADGVFVEPGPFRDSGGGDFERVGVGEGDFAEGADPDLGDRGIRLQDGVRRGLHVLAARDRDGDGGGHLPGEVGETREERLLRPARDVRVDLEPLRPADARGEALRRLDGGGVREMRPGEAAQDGRRGGALHPAHLLGERLPGGARKERRLLLGGEVPDPEVLEGAADRLRRERGAAAVRDAVGDHPVVGGEALVGLDRQEDVGVLGVVRKPLDAGQIGEVHREHFDAVHELVELVREPGTLADGEDAHELRGGLDEIRRGVVGLDERHRGVLDALAGGPQGVQHVVARGFALESGLEFGDLDVRGGVPDRLEIDARHGVEVQDLPLDFVSRLGRDAPELVGLPEKRGALVREADGQFAELRLDLLVRVRRVFASADAGLEPAGLVEDAPQVDGVALERGDRNAHEPRKLGARDVAHLRLEAPRGRAAAHRFVDLVPESGDGRGGLGGIPRLQKASEDVRVAAEQIAHDAPGIALRKPEPPEHRLERVREEAPRRLVLTSREEPRLERFRRGARGQAVVAAE